MASLYELTGQYKLIQQLIEDGEGDFSLALEQISGDVAEKLEGYAMVMKNIQSDIDGLKAEEKRLADRRKAMENSIDRMKQAMSDALQTIEVDKDGKKRLKTEKFTFSFRASSKVEIVDERKLSKFWTKPKVEIDVAKIKERLANGGIVPGAKLVENQSLQIK